MVAVEHISEAIYLSLRGKNSESLIMCLSVSMDLSLSASEMWLVDNTNSCCMKDLNKYRQHLIKELTSRFAKTWYFCIKRFYMQTLVCLFTHKSCNEDVTCFWMSLDKFTIFNGLTLISRRRNLLFIYVIHYSFSSWTKRESMPLLSCPFTEGGGWITSKPWVRLNYFFFWYHAIFQREYDSSINNWIR